MRTARLRVRWRRFAATRWGRWVTWSARQLLTVAVVGYLVYRMSQIGWAEIWAELPRTPWFYVIFAAMYLVLPVFQAIIFGLIWSLSPVYLFPATLKKRIYNKDVLSYSGDVYLYFWARDRLKRPARAVMHAIKDNAILSSVMSTLVAFGLLATFLLSGLVAVPSFLAERGGQYVIGTAIVFGILLAAGVKFRRNVFRLSGQLLLAVSALHLVRLLAVMSLQVLEWDVVIPGVDLRIWFTYLAVQIMVTRIPFLPSRDLIFLAFGIEMASAVQLPRAAIAGVLGVHSMLDKGLNLLLFSVLSVWDRKNIEKLSSLTRDGMPDTGTLEADSERMDADEAARAPADEAAAETPAAPS
jgi:hypothetical protein